MNCSQRKPSLSVLTRTVLAHTILAHTILAHTILAHTVLCAVLCTALLTPAWASQLEDNEPIDMSLKDAPLVQVLRSFASIMGGDSMIDPAVSGKVTIDLDDSPWRDALEQICLQQEVNCEILNREKPVLRVRPLLAVEGIRLQPGLPEAIDLALKKAALRQTLESFEVITGRTVELAEGVQGAVTLNLYGAPWSVVLEEVCDLEGCVVEWREEGIHIGPQQTPSSRRTDLELDEVALVDALEIIAGLPLFAPLGVPEVEVDDGLLGTVSVNLEGAHWVEILNAALGPLNLEWKFHYGAPSRLEVGPASTEKKPQQGATLRPRPSSGSEGFELSLRLFPATTPSLEGTALFNWQRPLHGVTASDGWRFQTSWIPFSPDLQVLIPMLVRCGGNRKAPSEVHLFEAIRLPLKGAWSSKFEAMLVELEPLATAGRQTSSTPSAENGCPIPRNAGSELTVAQVEEPASSKNASRLALPGEIGAYLLITLPGENHVAAAVVALGGVGDAQRLALLKPDGAGGVEVLEQILAPGEAIAEVGPPQRRFGLRLSV